MARWFFRAIANVARRILEWAERHSEEPRHIIDLIRDIYGCR
jgi:hypothetical protein